MNLGEVLEEIAKRQRTTDRVRDGFDKAIEVTGNPHDYVRPRQLHAAVTEAANIRPDDRGKFMRLVAAEARSRGAKYGAVGGKAAYRGLKFKGIPPSKHKCHHCGADYDGLRRVYS